MKRFILLVWTISLVFFVGCESRTEVSDTQKVDFIGIWNYDITYKNGQCDHLSAKGTIDITLSEGDPSKIGLVMRKGDKFDIGKDQNCVLSKTEDSNDAFLGYDRLFTKKGYLDYLKKFHKGNKALLSIKITEFNQDKITVKEEFSNGVLITFKYHR
jgi:hypothetical protein